MASWISSTPGRIGSARCPNGHPPIIRIICADCGNLTVFSGQSGKQISHRTLGWSIAILLLSSVGALVMFRLSGSPWPAYGFAVLSIVNLYAIVFSRGTAAVAVTLATVVYVLAWAAWILTIGTGPMTVDQIRWPYLAAWVIVAVYAFCLGGATALSAVRFRGSYLLGIIVIVCGLWLSIALDLQYHLDYTSVLDVAIIVGIVTPIALIIAAVRPRQSGAIASYLVAVSAYLTVVQYLVKGLNYGLTDLAPRALGVSAARPRPDPAWLVLLQWKAAVSAFVALGAAAVIVGTSVAVVARAFTANDWPMFVSAIRASAERLRQNRDALSRISEQTVQTAMRVVRIVYLVGVFVLMLVIEIARTTWNIVRGLAVATLNAVRYMVAPILCLSLVSILLITVIRDLARYASGSPGAFSAAALWGGLVCVAALVLLLLGGALGFAPLSPGQRFAMNGTSVALFLASGYWALYSVVCLALWPIWSALRELRVEISALKVGPLLLDNAIFVAITIFALIVFVLLLARVSDRRGTDASPKAAIIPLVVVLTSFIAFALFVGTGPLSNWLIGQA
jgi:hypothetical protein